MNQLIGNQFGYNNPTFAFNSNYDGIFNLETEAPPFSATNSLTFNQTGNLKAAARLTATNSLTFSQTGSAILKSNMYSAIGLASVSFPIYY